MKTMSPTQLQAKLEVTPYSSTHLSSLLLFCFEWRRILSGTTRATDITWDRHIAQNFSWRYIVPL